MAVKLDTQQTTTALATFVGVMYTLKSLWIAIAPDGFGSFMQWAHPNVNVSAVYAPGMTPGSFLTGLVLHVVVAWIVAYIFVWFWNNYKKELNFGKGGRRRR